MMTNIKNFDIAEVQEWLFANGFGCKADIFASCEIDGGLLMELSYTELTQDLEFTDLEARHLLSAIQMEACPVVKARPRTPSPATRSVSPFSPAHQSVPAPSAPFAPSYDARSNELEILRQENRLLQAENARLKAMYDDLLQKQQQQGFTATASQPSGQSSFHTQWQSALTPSPAPAPAPAHRLTTPQWHPSQPPAQSSSTTQQLPSQSHQKAEKPAKKGKKTGMKVLKGAGKGALGGAAMGAVAGAILPGVSAKTGAKAGAAMGALGGGFSGMKKTSKSK